MRAKGSLVELGYTRQDLPRQQAEADNTLPSSVFCVAHTFEFLATRTEGE